MKAILQSNRGPLVAIQQAACTAAGALESAKSFALGDSNTTAPPWLQCCNAMSGLSHLLQMAINVGNAISLRKMLREGQKRVTKKRIPLLAACARIAQGQYPENLGAVAECLPVDCMALDCGETSPATDHALKIALAHLKTDADDAELWRLLPFALAATFTDPVWKAKDVEYLVKVDAHTNNAHLMVVAARSLSFCFESMSVGAGVTSGGEDSAVDKSLQNFLRCSVHILLGMKLHDNGQAFKDYPLRAMVVLLEKFIDETSGLLDRSTLENILPHSLVHCATTDISLGRDRGEAGGAEVFSALRGHDDGETKE